MMKTLLVSCLLGFALSAGSGSSTTVYVCTKGTAYAYHAKKTCRNLKRCVEEGHVKAVSLEKAKDMGRRACKVCY